MPGAEELWQIGGTAIPMRPNITGDLADGQDLAFGQLSIGSVRPPLGEEFGPRWDPLEGPG